jgi:hypothetical protein
VNPAELRIDGELYLTVELVAEVYEVTAVWLGEACDRGLVGGLRIVHERTYIAAAELDRVASLVRLRGLLGPDALGVWVVGRGPSSHW